MSFNHKKMRILLLSADSGLIDGINRHILTVAPAINTAEGFEAAVCVVREEGDLTRELNARGVKTYALNASSGHDISVFHRFKRVLDSSAPDVIHIHNLAMMQRFVLSWHNCNATLVQTIHGIGDQGGKPSLKSRLEKALGRFAPLRNVRYAFISKGVKDFLNGDGPVIYNPIQVKPLVKTCKLREELSLDGEVPLIGTACRFAGTQKRPELLIEVMGQVLTRVANAHAVLIGDGDPAVKKDMRKIARTYDIGNRLHWLGYRKDAPDLAGELDMFVMTSRWEGLPTALLEAMTKHTPVAFLRGDGGLKDLEELNRVEDQFACIGDTPTALSDEIVAHLVDRAKLKQMGDAAIDIVRDNFAISKIVDQLVTFYKSAAEARA